MKLIIQIPCFNEEKTLPITLAGFPRKVEGFDSVEWLVIDDGSSDDTSAVARTYGVDHIVRHPVNRGLAKAFMTGITSSLAKGADVIINIDADNQYNAADIPALLEPIAAGKTGFVIGIRPVYAISAIPLIIKLLHKTGSVIVMKASGTRVTDPPSGFRAFTREVAEKLKVYNNYTYTIETIIQAGKSGINIETVPVRVNMEKLRPSRLMSSPYSYVTKSAVIILRGLVRYDCQTFFSYLCLPLFVTIVLAALAALFMQNSLLPIVVLIAATVTLLLFLLIALPVLFSPDDTPPSGHAPDDAPEEPL